MSRQRAIAEKIVDLVAIGTKDSLSEAVSFLSTFYYGDSVAVCRAYEFAVLVVVKRRLENHCLANESRVCIDADLLALKAAEEIAIGNTEAAFSYLRAASQNGATVAVCRHIAYQVIRNMNLSDREICISYPPKYSTQKMTLVEIGVVSGQGLIMIPEFGQIKFDNIAKLSKKMA